MGGLLVLLGSCFLVSNLLDIRLGQFVWPFFILVPGVALFLFALLVQTPASEPLSIAGSIVSMVGFILLYQNITDHFESWAYAWALVAPTSIGLGQIIYGRVQNKPEAVHNGRNRFKVGLAIFLVAAVFFELIIGIGGFGLGRYGWPMALILLGLFLLARNFRPERNKA